MHEYRGEKRKKVNTAQHFSNKNVTYEITKRKKNQFSIFVCASFDLNLSLYVLVYACVYKHCKRIHAIIFHGLNQKSTTHVRMCYCVMCVRNGHVCSLIEVFSCTVRCIYDCVCQRAASPCSTLESLGRPNLRPSS